MKTFGGVPWYAHVLQNTDMEQLYKGRDSRQTVARKIYEDLTFSSENFLTTSEHISSSTRVSKYVALALKSRFCLFEGTYRKYHTELKLDSADFYLRESIKASEELMNSRAYSLVDLVGNRSTQYRDLFTNINLNTQEVIFGMQFDGSFRKHDVTWKYLHPSYGSDWGLARQWINMYLNTDGSRFTDLPDYESTTYQNEFTNRDLRMAQTMVSPTYKRKSTAGSMYCYAPHMTTSFTGYQPIKWVLDDDIYAAAITCYNSIPIYRYAEILFNYPEAKAELGKMVPTIWNNTI